MIDLRCAFVPGYWCYANSCKFEVTIASFRKIGFTLSVFVEILFADLIVGADFDDD